MADVFDFIPSRNAELPVTRCGSHLDSWEAQLTCSSPNIRSDSGSASAESECEEACAAQAHLQSSPYSDLRQCCDNCTQTSGADGLEHDGSNLQQPAVPHEAAASHQPQEPLLSENGDRFTMYPIRCSMSLMVTCAPHAI